MLLWKHPWLKGVPNSLYVWGWLVKKDFWWISVISVWFLSSSPVGFLSPAAAWFPVFRGFCLFGASARPSPVTWLCSSHNCSQCDNSVTSVTHCVTHCVTTLLYFGGTTSYNCKQINVENGVTTAHPLLHICHNAYYPAHYIFGICLFLHNNGETHKKIFNFNCHLRRRGENCFIFWTCEGCSESWKQLCLLHRQSIKVQIEYGTRDSQSWD